jgi:nucleotide-binding universal stress UspA family protein
MSRKPGVLCPVDFSEASRGALRYAGAIAEHFGARLTVLTANDPLLTEAAEFGGSLPDLTEDTRRELQRFVNRTFAGRTSPVLELQLQVLSGKPAPEVLRVAREEQSDLIVMSSHGLTGMRKMFFGSTTERVLRETSIPVLVTPAADPGPGRVHENPQLLRRVLTPVDLTEATTLQVRASSAIAEAASVPLLLLTVVEPVRKPLLPRAHLPNIDSERRDRAERALAGLIETLPRTTRTEALVVFGEPAEEIAKVAQDRDAGLIVLGLHSTELAGPRLGSVTYRVLCLTDSMVLALPPTHRAAEEASGEVRSYVHK